MKLSYFVNIFIFNCILINSAFADFAVKWNNYIGVVPNGNTFVKTEPYGYDNAGASSVNILNSYEDGYLEFIPNNLRETRAIGLSKNTSNGVFTSMDYCFLIDGANIKIFDIICFKNCYFNCYFSHRGISTWFNLNSSTSL